MVLEMGFNPARKAMKMLLNLFVIFQLACAVDGGSGPPRDEPFKPHGLDNASAGREIQTYGKREFVSHLYPACFV